MHQIDNIWIFGDSYGSDDCEHTYINILKQKFNANIRHLGQRGHGPISTYERFADAYRFINDGENFDLCIILWSESYRRCDKHGLPIPGPNSAIRDPYISENYKLAVNLYHTHLQNHMHDIATLDAVQKATSTMCLHKNILNLQYFCFPEEAKYFNNDFNLSSFSVTSDNLDDYTEEEFKNFKNHMSQKSNKLFAEKIINDYEEITN